MTERDDPLRRAAILIDSLDNGSADVLFGQMGPEQAARVRNAILDLGPVDADERQQVIEAFMQQGTAASPAAAEAGGVEIDESLAEKINSATDEPEPDSEEEDELPPDDTPAAFSILREAPVETLAECLSGEHPQTIGVVLAHLPSRRAAQLLDCLPGPIQSEVLRRLASLDEMDETVLDELEQQLLLQLDRVAATESSRKKGFAVLEAILDAADHESRRMLLADLEASDRRLVRKLGYPSTVPLPPATTIQLKPVRREDSSPRRQQPAIGFADLMTLDDANLARLLRAVEPEVALLALTGASRQFVDRILDRMPPRASKALRRRMAQLGPVRLSDMERAQQQLAELALRMADEGLIELPSSRRFLVAV